MKIFTQTLMGLVHVYRIFISPFQYILRVMFGIQCECRFYPTCSLYALQCLRKYSLIKACKLIVYRLLRCHPFGQGGYDPVP